jgi:hypothetical protein
MYESLKRWLDVPVTVKPFLKRTGAGDKMFGTPYTIHVYPVSKEEKVRNAGGVEIISNSQLYVDGSTVIHRLDNVLFEGDELPIQAIHVFYRNGVPDLKVVYL